MSTRFTPEQRQAWLTSLPGLPVGASMLLEDTAGRLLIVKASYKRHWTMPGGVVDADESPKQAAIRETFEEVGLTLGPEAVRFVQAIYISSPTRNRLQFVFKTNLTKWMVKNITLQASEIESYELVSKDEVRQGTRTYAPPVIGWANGDLPSYSEQTREN